MTAIFFLSRIFNCIHIIKIIHQILLDNLLIKQPKMTTNTQKLSFTFFSHDYLHVKNQHDPSITSADTTHKTILQYDLLGMKKKKKQNREHLKFPILVYDPLIFYAFIKTAASTKISRSSSGDFAKRWACLDKHNHTHQIKIFQFLQVFENSLHKKFPQSTNYFYR